RGGAAGGAPGRARRIPRIARPAMNRVDALPVPEISRDVGLADDDGAARFEARDGDRIVLRQWPADTLYAPGRRQSRYIEGFLDRHRHTEERPPVSTGKRGVSGGSGHTRPPEIPHHHRVEVSVPRFDPGDRLIQRLDRRNAA